MSIIEAGRGEGNREDRMETEDIGNSKCALEKGIHCLTETQS